MNLYALKDLETGEFVMTPKGKFCWKRRCDAANAFRYLTQFWEQREVDTFRYQWVDGKSVKTPMKVIRGFPVPMDAQGRVVVVEVALVERWT
jgi:hypothetical protein